MDRWRIKMKRARTALTALRAIVSTGRIPRAERLWRGAHVVIVDQPQPAPAPGSIEAFYGLDREIVTSYGLELSWLFERLRDAFAGLLDGCTKLEFYGRLQRAANQASAVSDIGAGALCDSLINEAFAVLCEMGEGSFAYLLVARGREIAADSAELMQ